VTVQVERQMLAIDRADRDVKSAFLAMFEAELELSRVRGKLDSSKSEVIAELKADERSTVERVITERSSIDRLLKQIGAIDAKIAALQDDISNISAISQMVSSYERLEEMTGKAGLPYRILTRVLPVINSEIEKILSGITKFSIFFEDDQEAQNVSLFIRYGDYRSRPLSLGSGAEKFIAAIAVRVALLNVSSLPKTDVLIIDEGFGKLDPEHLESLQKMFEYLKEAFGTVFIVSHVDSMRDVVDHSIEIVSQDGYAHVEVC
jgi:exonuclease SbcC